MKYINIPETNIDIPTISLGTMTFGGQTDEATSLSIMDYAYEQGITLFDTANIYNGGESEKVVGKWISKRRDDIILASKVGYPSGTKLSDICLSKEGINKEIEDSLTRLKTDYIDIYYFHAPDYKTPIEESLETMTKLKEAGKIKYLAVSNFAAWQIADLLAASDKNGYIKPIMTQNVYNAITRTIEPELIPFLKEHEMALTVYNPLAAGLLTGKHRKGIPLENSRLADNAIYKSRYWTDANLKSAKKLEAIGKDAGMTILDLAISWCISNNVVTSMIVGVSKLNQLEQNLSSYLKAPLSDEIMEACNNVWEEHTGKPFGYNR